MENETPLTLLHILNNQCLLPVFRIYCRSQGVDEYLNFWFEVRMYTNKYLYEKVSPPERSDCKQLFKKYFHPESIHHIALEPALGQELQTRVEEGGAMADFVAAQRYAFDVLEVKMKAFATSEEYKSFMRRENSLFQKPADRPFDAKELDVHFRRVADAQQHLKTLFTELCGKLTTSTQTTSHLNTLSNGFREFAESMDQVDSHHELSDLVHCLKKISSIMSVLERLEKHMNHLVATTFESVNESLQTDLAQAAALQKKLEKMPSNDPAAMEALNTLRQANNRVDHRTFRALTVLMEEYLVYFEKGYSLMQKVLPNLEKYKQTIQAAPGVAQ